MLLRNLYDIFSIVHLTMHFVITYLAWNRHQTSDNLYTMLYCAVLCYYSFSCACVAHNCMHCRTFHSRRLEKIYQHALTLSFGHPVLTLVPGHNLSHHKYTQSARDPMRTSKVQYQWHWLNLILFQPTVAWDVFKIDLRYMSMQRIMNSRYFWDTSMQWSVLVLSQIILIYSHPAKFLIYVYFPHLFAQWAIVTMNILQHDGCQLQHIQCDADETVAAPKNFNTARNFTGVFLNIMTFNNGFHTIHHMYPNMHWSKLREEHNIHIRPHIHPSLDQTNLCTYAFVTFIFPGKRVDYLGNPIVFSKDEPGVDEDWTIEYAPPGLKLVDYDTNFSIRARMPLTTK